MKFVFNDSLAASVSVSETELTDIRFVPSGIILEKKIVTSATINNIDELLKFAYIYNVIKSTGCLLRLLTVIKKREL